MKKSIHMIIVLGVMGFIVGTILVLMNNYAQPLIKINQQKALETAIYQVIPNTKSFELVSADFPLYIGKDEQGAVTGYAFKAEGSGYQDKIKLMIGVNKTVDKLLAIEVLDSKETPGLGGKITENSFKDQFKGLNITKAVNYVKGKKRERDNEIQAITGATISSKSVVRIINNYLAAAKKTIQNR